MNILNYNHVLWTDTNIWKYLCKKVFSNEIYKISLQISMKKIEINFGDREH